MFVHELIFLFNLISTQQWLPTSYPRFPLGVIVKFFASILPLSEQLIFPEIR